MEKRRIRAVLSLIIITLLMLNLAGCSQTASTQTSQAPATQTIKDTSGRTVTIPAEVKRILAVHPVVTYMLYQLAPNKLVSVDTLFNDQYLGANGLTVYAEPDLKKLKTLPVTGVFFKGVDPEQILKLKPDVIVTIDRHPKLEEFASQMGIPVITFSKDSLPLYEQSLRFLGKIVGNEAEANKLADYWHTTIQAVTKETATIPADKKLRVYYANNSILTTPGPGSIMASIMDLAGGNNVAKGLPEPNNENTSVSLEQVIIWNPEVILTGSENDKQQIMSSPGWQEINAVKNKRVYVRPKYGNTDGISALMGLIWVQGKLLHANDPAFDQSFAQKMSEFYSIFFKYQIKPEQITEVK